MRLYTGNTNKVNKATEPVKEKGGVFEFDFN